MIHAPATVLIPAYVRTLRVGPLSDFRSLMVLCPFCGLWHEHGDGAPNGGRLAAEQLGPPPPGQDVPGIRLRLDAERLGPPPPGQDVPGIRPGDLTYRWSHCDPGNAEKQHYALVALSEPYRPAWSSPAGWPTAAFREAHPWYWRTLEDD